MGRFAEKRPVVAGRLKRPRHPAYLAIRGFVFDVATGLLRGVTA